MVGIRTRAKRDGRGTRTGGAASTRTREDQVAPAELVKLWSAAPWPELPNGTVGLASATGCFLAAVDFGGGRPSTRRMLTLDGPRTMAARTSEPGKWVSRTRRAEIARTCTQSAESGTRAVGRAQVGRTGVLAGSVRRGAGRTEATVHSAIGSNEIAEGAGRGRRLTTVPAAAAVSALGAVVVAAGLAAAGSSVTSTMVTSDGAEDCVCADIEAGWSADAAVVSGAAATAGVAGSSLTASFGAGVTSVSAGLASAGAAAVVLASGLFSSAAAVLSEEGVPASAASMEGVASGAGASAFAGSDEEDDGAGSEAGVAAGVLVVVVLVVAVLVVSAGSLGAGGGASWARVGRADTSAIEAVAKKATPNRLTPINRFLLAANGVSSR